MRIRDLTRPLFEAAALRTYDPNFASWLEQAKQRPDADELYVHGTFGEEPGRAPKTHEHQLLHFSKLTDPRFRSGPIHAEYYGNKIYLAKLRYKKPFDVWRIGSEAQRLADERIEGDWARQDGHVRRLDWGSVYDVIEPALQMGYDFFQVYENSVQTDSWAVPSMKQVQIVDKYISRENP